MISSSNSAETRVKIGFVPLVDSAPLVYALEKGLFAEAGLDVTLVREPGWASIRDKIVYGELDAAHAPVGFPLLLSWGLDSLRFPCETGFFFNSHGDAITVSDTVLDADGPLQQSTRILKFAVPSLYSSHHFLLRQWLRPFGAQSGREYTILVLPPNLMVDALKSGYIDGFCVGEPYSSIAQQQEIGVVVKESADLSPLHPEKCLLVSKAFSTERDDVHLALIAALNKAAKSCDTRKGREEIAEILARGNYLDLDASIIRQSLFAGTGTLKNDEFHNFSKFGINEPTAERANWVINHLRDAGLIPEGADRDRAKLGDIFRADLYHKAIAAPQTRRPRRKAPLSGVVTSGSDQSDLSSFN